MEEKITPVYEYVIVKEYTAGLEKGCRLCYDYAKQAYIFHTERDDTYNSDYYNTVSYSYHDVILSVDSVAKLVEDGTVIAGPIFGELELREEK